MGSGSVKYLLDTHAWIWWQMKPEALSPAAHAAIAGPHQPGMLLLSAISPWEFCKLLEKGRLGISCDPETWMAAALDMPGLQIAALTPRIAYRSTVLPPPFHSDPADQIIVATAREENAVLITKDSYIQQYDLVRTLW